MVHIVRGTAIFGISLLVLAGCQTPRHKEFQHIKEGMDKSAVLEVAGNPNRTQRWQGKDRWVYVYRPSETSVDIKEVHFQEGRVVYHGNPIPPAVSAEEQDRLNAESNREVEATVLLEIEAAKAARQLPSSSSPADEGQKTAPRYEPID